MSYDYWTECVSEAFYDAGINATPEQIEIVKDYVEGGHQNHDTATGLEITNANYISDEKRELDELKEKIEKRRIWVVETKPCAGCLTTGLVKDGWGRDQACQSCDGEGRL